MDPSAPRRKFPLASPYRRNAVPAGTAGTLASVTVTPVPFRNEKTAKLDGARPSEGMIRIEPVSGAFDAPEICSFLEVRGGIEYVKLLVVWPSTLTFPICPDWVRNWTF